AVATAIVAAGGLWFAARTELIENWGLFAALVVLTFAVIPVLPALLPPSGMARVGRSAPTALWLLVVLVLSALIPWETTIGSTGFRLLAILGWTGLAAIMSIGILGVNPAATDREPEPSPDELGLGSDLGKADAVAAGTLLGLDEDVMSLPTSEMLVGLRAGDPS
ncbi:MAG: hypothetical protein KDB15_06345, partial [Microthrixaceae bacterium]|nr:hypothetical protein [Microthrixaceae bacterium]